MSTETSTPQGISGTPATFTATRDELADALTRLDVRVLTTGPAAGMINAESMADAIIEALTGTPDPVHYRWPVACGEPSSSRITWSGRLDKVTCAACLAVTQNAAAATGEDNR